MDKIKKRFLSLIKNSEKITVITGAGISAESGVPTFRGKNGLWKNFKPEELATPFAFQKNPKLVWEWYNWRRNLISKCKPNKAHYFIAQLECIKNKFLLITQNVDGLHSRAGNKKLIEIHGSIWKVKCTKCSYNEENWDVPVNFPPLCPKCNNLLRPAVVWFGESLNYVDLDTSISNIIESELLIIVGTSGVVQPVASFPFQGKQQNSDLKIVEINLEPTPITKIADMFIQSKSAEFLSLILKSKPVS
jgi:NAD-dependent deacetylase